MFRFIIVSFCFLTGIAYIVQKNSGYDTGFSTSNNYVSANYNAQGYGDVDPEYTQERYEKTASTLQIIKKVETDLVHLALLPVKKPPVLLALPVLRPDPNAIPVQTASKTVNERITLSSAHGKVSETYQPKIFNVPSLKPEHMSPGKLLKQHQLEFAGNTAAVYRDKLTDRHEQYSRHSQVKLKKLFTSRLKRHPHGYRRRHLSAYSYYVRKRSPAYYAARRTAKKNAKKGRRRETRVSSVRTRARRRK